MRKGNILIIAASSVKSSQRVKRQIDWLCSGEYELFVIGYDKPDRSECCTYYELKPVFRQLSIFRKILIGILMFAGWHKRTFHYIYNIRELSDSLPFKNFDLIIAHDIRPLLIIELLGLRGKVLVDAHEYYYEYSASNLSDWLIKQQEKYLLKNYFEKQKFMTTVSHWIAKEYEKITHREVPVILNAPDYYSNLAPQDVDPSKIKIIHHGLADPNRKTEMMIEMMKYLPSHYELHLLLVSNPFFGNYIKFLQSKASSFSNVKILDPIPGNMIIEYSNKYDIGLFLLPPSCKSYEYALPNKFFEYIQSRLMIAISPNPEMTYYVKKFELGVVADDYSPKSLAQKVRNTSVEQIKNYKFNSHKAAAELNANNEKNKFESLVNDLIQHENRY